MTKEETKIVLKALKKAMDNGYKKPSWYEGLTIEMMIPHLIFSHDFAKAFWGEEEMSCMAEVKNQELNIKEVLVAWQHHLQQMVLEEEPLKYLEKFL